jgi:hypothetical protein
MSNADVRQLLDWEPVHPSLVAHRSPEGILNMASHAAILAGHQARLQRAVMPLPEVANAALEDVTIS